MKKRLFDILWSVVAAILVISCSEQEVLSSYQTIKNNTQPVPLAFSPYLGTSIEEEAITRADLNYLTRVGKDNNGDGNSNFNTFPWVDPSGTNTYQKGKEVDGTLNPPYYRFAQNNSYIVGIYGYYNHNWEEDTPISWSTLKDDENLTANFMTNQPLFHYGTADNNATWEYSPLRYWPNSTVTDSNSDCVDDTPVNVTFVNYYPFQDFSGEYKKANLDNCIEPPVPGATGTDAYTFTFTQKENLTEQVDFLLGINNDEHDRSLSSAGINLRLRHTLCAVLFDLRTLAEYPIPNNVRYDINSISLEGLYGKGKVYPTTDDPGFVWQDLDNDGTTYTLTFDDPSNFNYLFTRPYFDGSLGYSQQRLCREIIYNNNKLLTKAKGQYLDYPGTYAYGPSGAKGRGMKYLMLVIPQKAETDNNGKAKDAFIVVDYDLTVTNGDDKVVYKNNREKIKLKDSVKDKNTDQLFNAGKYLTFNLQIKGPLGITMDAAVESEWGADLPGDVTIPQPNDLGAADFSFSKTKYIYNGDLGETLSGGDIPVLNVKAGLTGSVSYASDNVAVATIDATGEVTVIGYGVATIIATYSGDEDYNAKSVTYTLYVPGPLSNDDFKYNVASFTATKFDVDEDALPSLVNKNRVPVTYSSSNTSVATVDSNGKVKIIANGTAVITASFAGNEYYQAKDATYTLTVNVP